MLRIHVLILFLTCNSSFLIELKRERGLFRELLGGEILTILPTNNVLYGSLVAESLCCGSHKARSCSNL
jgi:hypothetical protein